MKTQPTTQNDSSSKQISKINYNKMSGWYDIFSIFEKKYRKKGLALLNPQKGESLLEIGFGTGQCIIPLAKKVGLNGQIYGIDISEGMIQKTMKKVRRKKTSSSVQLICGDAATLPFISRFFDGILISFTIELFEKTEIPKILVECKRALHASGRLCIISLSNRKTNLMVRSYEWFHRRFPKMIDCRPIPIRDFITAADFRIINIVEMNMWGLPVDVILAKKN